MRVLHNLRTKNEHLPVLVLSGEADVEARLSCLTQRRDDYLIKPFNKENWSRACMLWCARANGHANKCCNSAMCRLI
jgi:DNA-binding response OmpR family regulator